jgi:molecular chaperone GrpE
MNKKNGNITDEEQLDEEALNEVGKVGSEGMDVAELEELHSKLEESESKYRRALADYQNLQKRVSEEKQDWVRSANKELLLRLLPILDTLVLANQHDQSEGLKVSINQFLDTLKAEGVTKIKTVGEEFDPHLMECVVTEEGEDNKVLEELRSGYIMYDRVLRPAQVKVGKK